METFELREDTLGEALTKAVDVIGRGGVVAYPTETYYALGARFDDETALRRIFALKGRPRRKAMPLIAGSAETVKVVAAEINDTAKGLMDAYWPGALSILFRAREGLSDLITYDNTVAVRVPGGSFAQKLAAALTFPITSTSANPSGRPPAQDAGAVAGYFPQGIDLLVDGGTTPGGRPSTIVSTEGGVCTIIRAGAVDIGGFAEWKENP